MTRVYHHSPEYLEDRARLAQWRLQRRRENIIDRRIMLALAVVTIVMIIARLAA